MQPDTVHMCFCHAADSECARKHGGGGVSLAELFTSMLMQDESGVIVSENNEGLAGVRLHVWLHSRLWCRVAAAPPHIPPANLKLGKKNELWLLSPDFGGEGGQSSLTSAAPKLQRGWTLERRPKKGNGAPDWQPPSLHSSTSRGRGCRGQQEVKWARKLKKMNASRLEKGSCANEHNPDAPESVINMGVQIESHSKLSRGNRFSTQQRS